MPVFDFNNTPEPDAVPECTYTTFASDENVSSADKPLLVLDNSKKAWKHHSCGTFTNQNKRTAFEFKEDDGSTVIADIKKVDARFVNLLRWLGENHIPVRLSGENREGGYMVYRIRETAFGGGTKLSAEDGFLQFMIERLLASNAPLLEECEDEDLEEVGSTGTIIFLIIGFLLGLTAGFTVLTAQKYGAGKMDEMRQTVGNALILTAVISAVMTAISMTGMHALLKFMHTPDDIFKDAYAYVMIICGGIFAQALYNILASILRALGNSKVPLYFLILSAMLNIVLDLVFIIVFKLGTPGAAWATIISQGVSGVLCLIYIWKFVPELRMKKEDWYFRRGLAFKQIGVGIPMGLQYSITAIGTMMVQSALNMLGSYAVAAFTAGSKIEQIFTQAFVAQGTASATYNAQNIGAGKLERVREGFRASHFIGIIYSVVVGSFLFFAGKYFAYLFISDNIEEVLPMVAIYVKCVALFFIPLYFVNVLRNGIQGMGYGLLPMMAGVAELAGRGITATIAAGKSSYVGTCLASPVAWVFASVLLWGMYFYVMKDMSRKLYGTNKL